MSVDMKLSTNVSARDLFGELKKLGILEARTRDNDERARCLTDGRHCLWVYLSEDGVVEALKIYGLHQPYAILDAICATFGAEIYTEHDPQYWGCATQEEWEAAMPDIAGQFRWVEPSEEEVAKDKEMEAWFFANAIRTVDGWHLPAKGSSK
jgi:hypothetical protein